MAAAAVAAALAWMAPESSAATCPKQTFLSFGGYAYIAQKLPTATAIKAGAALGDGSLDEPTSADGCKRRRESVSVRKAGGIESRVAVMAFGFRNIFVLGSRCDGFEGDEHWRCLLEPLVFQGRRYTGLRYPSTPGPQRTVARGRPLGRAEADGSAVTVVRIPRVPASVAVAVKGRPNDAYVAAGVCPYESFENDRARDDLRRCLESPVWFAFDPPGAVAGDRIVGVADRPLPPQLEGAMVSLVRLAVADGLGSDEPGGRCPGRPCPFEASLDGSRPPRRPLRSGRVVPRLCGRLRWEDGVSRRLLPRRQADGGIERRGSRLHRARGRIPRARGRLRGRLEARPAAAR